MSRLKQNNPPSAPPLALQKQEIIRCGRDPVYFINTYVFIQHPKKGRLKFKTFDYQDRCIEEFQKDNNVITNKSRQLGLSTVSAAYSLWLALFHRDKNILVIATKLAIAQNFMAKVFYAYDYLPKWLVMSKTTKRTKTELDFSNGSKLKAIPTSKEAGRSEALSLLIVDECAHIADMDEIWTGIQPTLSTGGKAILISSPNGVGNTFHRIWVDAESGTNDFVPIELPWTVHPERDQKWFDKESANIRAGGGERAVQQEFFCNFNASGDTFVAGSIIAMYEKNTSEPIGKHPKWGDLWYWKVPEEGHRYLIPADVARGNSTDFSTFHVIDTDTDEQVAEYKGKVAPDILADILHDVGYQYNTALICPELNSYGALTSQMLKKREYPNLYYEKVQKNIYMAYTNPDTALDLPGWTSTPKGRDEAMAKLENALRNKTLRINSKRFVEELKTFIWKGNKAQAMKGYNDDLVIALAIGVNLYESAGRPKYSEEEISRGFIQGMSTSRSAMGATISDWGYQQQTSSGPGGIPLPGSLKTNPFLKPIGPSSVPGANSQSQNRVQDLRNPYYSQFDWVWKD